ncbi:N-acetyltransferase [Flavobacterium cerinum]|uniref:N-acetyltransferase n=1 Tax=Flavobacterium cerinum TaxID=2502784 RepID=A0ABY5IRD6_9FLAO|nr:N-acetyltransferase [Flavobacterium cerinum]UUC44343.1 N-acetyltransferase [Flavobacterium cerinum]
MIRKLQPTEIDETVALWYAVSVKAHDFIAAEYWEANKAEMAQTYLPNSDTYVFIENNTVGGFVSMVDSFLAAIFVATNLQGKGIGKQLIDFVKQQYPSIQLKVYKKNGPSILFYQKQGFVLLEEQTEVTTGETECLMQWQYPMQ